MSRDNLWISLPGARSGRQETPVAESPKLPEVRHLLWSWDPASGWPGARDLFRVPISETPGSPPFFEWWFQGVGLRTGAPGECITRTNGWLPPFIYPEHRLTDPGRAGIIWIQAETPRKLRKVSRFRMQVLPTGQLRPPSSNRKDHMFYLLILIPLKLLFLILILQYFFGWNSQTPWKLRHHVALTSPCPAGRARRFWNSQTPGFLRLFAELQDPRHLRPGKPPEGLSTRLLN